MIPDYINPDLWADFLQHRREIRHKLTPTATKFLLRKLEKFHNDKINVNDCLTRAIENGWQGVFPIQPEQQMKRQYLPTEDSDLWPWAKMNGYPDPGRAETNQAYRQRLGHLMRQNVPS